MYNQKKNYKQTCEIVIKLVMILYIEIDAHIEQNRNKSFFKSSMPNKNILTKSPQLNLSSQQIKNPTTIFLSLFCRDILAENLCSLNKIYLQRNPVRYLSL